ncbi:MAG: endonuclease/exonuclease/phosphatase family protein [Zoogloeaceae bacterium]|nr:endonuclease/exonuclease/phosphatase family protein [Zoogloeaceae bacterium]
MCAAILGWTGDWHWLPELFSHFFLQYALLLLLVTVLLFWARAGHWRWAALAALGLSGWVIAPFWWPAPPPSPLLANRTPVTFFQFNAKQNSENLLRWLKDKPKAVDVVLVLEAEPTFAEDMTALAAEFPHHIERLDDSPFSIALYSRYPFYTAEVLDVGDNFPALRVELVTPNGPLRVLGIHPPPPLGDELASWRNRFLRVLGEQLAQAEAMPTLVFGDVNATVFSPQLRAFMTHTGLRDAQRGQGAGASWPSFSARFWGFLGIPIDTLLVSPEIEVRERRLLPHLGSDHLPVSTRLVY